MTNEIRCTTPIVEWFRGLDLPLPAHYNQSTMFRAARRVNPATLRDSLRLLAVYHDMLRARWDGSALVLREPTASHLVRVEEHDLAGSPDAKLELTKLANDLQRSACLSDGPLVRAALFHLSDGDAVLISIHHLVVDGVSWRILAEDLNSVYGQLLEGSTGARLPRPRGTFPDYAARLADWAKGDEAAKELPHWTQVADAVRRAVPPKAGGKIAWRPLLVPAEATKRLLTDGVTRLGAGVNDLLLTALARAWRRTTGAEELVLSLEGHGREPFGEKPPELERIVGWFTTIYPVVVGAHDEPFAETLRRVSSALAAVPNKGFGYGALRYLGGHGEIACPTQMTFNYLGSFEENAGESAFFTIDDELPQGTAVAEENCAGMGFSLNCSATPRGLEGVFSYDTASMDAAGAERFAQAFAEEIEKLDA